MANPKGNPQNLRKGGGPGRKKGQALPSRAELLERIIQRPGELPGSESLLDDVVTRLHELAVTSNSSATIEWLFNQLIGSPKSTIKHDVSDTQVFIALGRVLPEFLASEAECKRFLYRLQEELGANA